MTRLTTLLAVLLLATAGCALTGGLSADDQALCKRVETVNPYMDALGNSSNAKSATSVFAALSGADDENLAQVGRDYSNAHPQSSFEYEQRAKKICDEG